MGVSLAQNGQVRTNMRCYASPDTHARNPAPGAAAQAHEDPAELDVRAAGFIVQQAGKKSKISSNRLRKSFVAGYASQQQHEQQQQLDIAGYDSIPLWRYLLQHGRSIMAISTFQPGLYYFELPGIGYLAYALMSNGPEFLHILSPVVLSDPVCDPAHFEIMAKAFLHQHPTAMFMQVSSTFARVLQGTCGLYINSVGGETELDLATFAFSGYARRGLRSAIAGAVKEGIFVEEVMTRVCKTACSAVDSSKGQGADISRTSNVSDSSASSSTASSTIKAAAHVTNCSTIATHRSGNSSSGNSSSGVTEHFDDNTASRGSADAGPDAASAAELAHEMRIVDQQWVSAKGANAARVWFLNRLPVFAPEPGVRKLVARDKNGKMLAFIFFDAVYEAGTVVGYYANVTRMSPDAHPGVLNLIIKEFIDKLRLENKMAAPAKKVSMKKSQRDKLAAAAAAAASQAPSMAAAAADKSAVKLVPVAPKCGVRFVSLGLSPMHQVDDSHFTHSKELHNTFNRMFKTGAAFYPFKTLASAKAKYGGGLVNGVHEDNAVTYRPVYLAHSHKNGIVANIALFDFGKLVGFWDHPLDAAAAFAAYQVTNKTRKLALRWKATRQQKQQLRHQAQQQSLQQGCGQASMDTAQAVHAVPQVKGHQQAARVAGKPPMSRSQQGAVKSGDSAMFLQLNTMSASGGATVNAAETATTSSSCSSSSGSNSPLIRSGVLPMDMASCGTVSTVSSVQLSRSSGSSSVAAPEDTHVLRKPSIDSFHCSTSS